MLLTYCFNLLFLSSAERNQWNSTDWDRPLFHADSTEAVTVVDGLICKGGNGITYRCGCLFAPSPAPFFAFNQLENCGNLPAKALSEKGAVRQSVDGLTKVAVLRLPPGRSVELSRVSRYHVQVLPRSRFCFQSSANLLGRSTNCTMVCEAIHSKWCSFLLKSGRPFA